MERDETPEVEKPDEAEVHGDDMDVEVHGDDAPDTSDD